MQRYDASADDTHRNIAILTYVQMSLEIGGLFLDLHGCYP